MENEIYLLKIYKWNESIDDKQLKKKQKKTKLVKNWKIEVFILAVAVAFAHNNKCTDICSK